MRYDILEMVEQFEKLFGAQSVGIFRFDASHFISQTPMHVFWGLFVDVPERILYCIFVNPNSCSKFIAFEILQ